jgi:DNA polymerase/3'-5' exonuclease PolX
MSCTRVKYLTKTGTSTTTVPKMSNKQISDQLMLLSYVMASKGDIFRSRAYETTAKIVLRTPIETILTSKIEGVGPSSRQRITNILQGIGIPELADIDIKLILELRRVNGIGLKEAKKLTDLGVTSIQDLKYKYESNLIQLNNNQVFGLYHLEQLERNILRDEVESSGRSILKLLPESCFGDITGSYRRLKYTRRYRSSNNMY